MTTTFKTWNSRYPWAIRTPETDNFWNVVSYILELNQGLVLTATLHRMLYFSQGIALSQGISLFENKLYAWYEGPVVIDLHKIYKLSPYLKVVGGNWKKLSSTEIQLIEAAVNPLIGISLREINKTACITDPYLLAFSTESQEITRESMIEYFES